MDDVIDSIFKYLPYGPQFYDEDTITDQPERAICAEIIREKALHALSDEVPHGIAVAIDQMKPRKGGKMYDIDATIVCERDSHKGIIIGKQGRCLKDRNQCALRDGKNAGCQSEFKTLGEGEERLERQ